uniref:Succinate dehydrogenase cytochrome b560 subunit, mitochondrial n=1 Tax=Globodera pallida TaxID=36090 RepID=A0A183CP43_GLOPA
MHLGNDDFVNNCIAFIYNHFSVHPFFSAKCEEIVRLFCSNEVCPFLLPCNQTPVQEFGYEYVKRQMNMGRPVSPHLTIYKPQLTWLMSGAHRIVGCVMSAVLLMGDVVLPFCRSTSHRPWSAFTR